MDVPLCAICFKTTVGDEVDSPYPICKCKIHQSCSQAQLEKFGRKPDFLKICWRHVCLVCASPCTDNVSGKCVCNVHSNCASKAKCLLHLCQHCGDSLGAAPRTRFSCGCAIHNTCIPRIPSPIAGTNCPWCRYKLKPEDLAEGWAPIWPWISWATTSRKELFAKDKVQDKLAPRELIEMGMVVGDLAAYEYTVADIVRIGLTWDDLLEMGFQPSALLKPPFSEYRSLSQIKQRDGKPLTADEWVDKMRVKPGFLADNGVSFQEIALLEFKAPHFYKHGFTTDQFVAADLSKKDWETLFGLTDIDLTVGWRLTDQQFTILSDTRTGWGKWRPKATDQQPVRGAGFFKPPERASSIFKA
jgi:hypothetical protein